MIALTSAAVVVAQQGAKPGATGEGTLKLQDKSFALKHAVAYETKAYDEEVIAVVLSGQAVSGEMLKAAIKAEKNDDFPEFTRPYIRLEFAKSGELKHWSAASSNTSIGRKSADKATGEFKLENGRLIGKASQPTDTDGMFATAFDVRFDVPLLKAGETPTIVEKKRGPAANVKSTVSGVFKGNGKDGKLAFVSAHWGEPFSDKAGIVLVFTEKDHTQDKKPDFNAAFAKFGSALIISLHEDGSIYGCQVVHTAHKKQGFSSIGNIRTNDFEYADGKVEGEITTDGEIDTFGEKWEVNIRFVAPLGEIPAALQPKPEKAAAKDDSDDEDDEEVDADALVKSLTSGSDAKPAAETKGQPPAGQLKAKELALTKDASDVEYKGLVGQLAFKSKSGVKAACTELTTNLKAQGWTTEGSDLITPASSILKRKRGKASLTIFVKPAGSGSEVKMMTEGLDWNE